jgi:hypothetical protein
VSDTVGAALAAAASRLGVDAAPVLARIAGFLGESARQVAAELAVLDDAAAQRRRAEIAALARSPSLAALRGVHPTWIEVTLSALPPRARTALAGQSTDETDVWLVRWVLAALPPMPATEPLDLVRLQAIAHDQLAFALGAAAASVPALRAAVARIAVPPRAGALGSHRAALERCRGVTLDDAGALLRVAARVIAPHLADEPVRRLQITRRLPYPDGSLVERELLAHANTPLDQVPTRAALF